MKIEIYADYKQAYVGGVFYEITASLTLEGEEISSSMVTIDANP